MRHVTTAQAGEIIGGEELRIANLHRVTEVGRQRGQKRVQAGDELIGGGETAPAESAEFENQHASLAAVGQQRAEEHLPQRNRIEKRRILPAALRAVARMGWKHFAGYLFRHFEGELKMRRRLRK